MQRSTNSTRPNIDELKHAHELIPHSFSLLHTTDEKYCEGGIYQIRFTNELSSTQMCSLTNKLNRFSQYISRENEFFQLDEKICFRASYLKTWNDRIDEYYISSGRGKKDVPINDVIFYPSLILDGFYQSQQVLKPKTLSSNFQQKAFYCYKMPASSVKLPESESELNDLVGNATNCNFHFFYSSEHSALFINEATYRALNHAKHRFPTVKSKQAYHKILKSRREAGEEVTLEQVQLQSTPSLAAIFNDSEYWEKFIASLNIVRTPVHQPPIPERDYSKILFEEPLEKDPNWFQIRVPKNIISKVAKNMRHKAARFFGERFRNTYDEAILGDASIQKVTKLLNPNYSNKLFIYINRDAEIIFASRATAAAWNEGVRKRFNMEDEGNSPTIPITTNPLVEPAEEIPVRQAVGTKRIPDTNYPQQPRVRRRLRLIVTPERENESSPVEKQNESNAMELEQSSSSSLSTVIQECSNSLCGNPMTFFAPSNANNSKFLLKVMKQVGREMKAYLRQFIYTNNPASNLNGIQLTEEQLALIARDSITNAVANIPVQLNNKIYDLQTLVNFLENDTLRPNTVPVFSYQDIQPANQANENLRLVLKQVESTRNNIDWNKWDLIARGCRT